MTRYFFPRVLRVYRRKCYDSLYKRIKEIMLDASTTLPVILITGVPGIGKSMFSLFLMIQSLLDDEFPVNSFVTEYSKGDYCLFTLVNKTAFSSGGEDSTSNSTTCEIVMHMEQGYAPDVQKDLILSDIRDLQEPSGAGRWTCIFSSPNPLRFKQTMKAPHNCRFTMPTWSEQELEFANEDKHNNWYERFTTFGGVPRFVLWDGKLSDPSIKLHEAISAKGSSVIDQFFTKGFGGLDPEQSYTLIHINPPWLPEQCDWDYGNDNIYSFASDTIFKHLAKEYERSLLSAPINLFNAGVAPEVYGGGSAGNLFEKVVLWLKPIAGKMIEMRSLEKSGDNNIEITLPSCEILDHSSWQSANKSRNGTLQAGLLYQPRISNLESGDCLCVVEMEGQLVLVVLQMTVGEKHPVKAHGLKCICRAYLPSVRSQIKRKILCFVIPTHGKLNEKQPFHTKKGIVAAQTTNEVRDFEQYVCAYAI
eukprot:gene11834-13343_t